MSAEYKAGFVALLGLPNAGKSTLVNALVGEKVSVVTAKPQTTRNRIMGIRTDGSKQTIFIDAPGFVNSTSGLNSFLKSELSQVLESSDMLLVVIAADHPIDESRAIIQLAEASGKPWLGIINRIDFVDGPRVQDFERKLKSMGREVITGSALKKPAAMVPAILNWIWDRLPSSPGLLYDPEDYSTSTLRQMAAEIVREKCFEGLHQEIPYGLAVRIESFKENEGPVIKIAAEILVAKENHKAMVVGAGGNTIKRIGMSARKDMEKLLGRQVYLQLQVVWKKDWMKDRRLLRELGYVISEQTDRGNK